MSGLWSTFHVPLRVGLWVNQGVLADPVGFNANNLARYVYGTMIGESMTRDTKSAGAGAMRVVVNIKDSIIDTTNIRDTATIIKDITTTSTISNIIIIIITHHHHQKSVIKGWCLDALLSSYYLGLHWKPQGTCHQDLHFRNLYQLYLLTQEQKKSNNQK